MGKEGGKGQEEPYLRGSIRRAAHPLQGRWQDPVHGAGQGMAQYATVAAFF